MADYYGMCGNGAPRCREPAARGYNPLRLCERCLARYRAVAREVKPIALSELGTWQLSPLTLSADSRAS